MAKKARTEVPADVVAGFAREFADWRLGGCPGYGFHATFKVKVEKVARRHGQPYVELWGRVHAEAYRIIDAAS